MVFFQCSYFYWERNWFDPSTKKNGHEFQKFYIRPHSAQWDWGITYSDDIEVNNDDPAYIEKYPIKLWIEHLICEKNAHAPYKFVYLILFTWNTKLDKIG